MAALGRKLSVYLPPAAAMHFADTGQQTWQLAPQDPSAFHALPLNQVALEAIPESVRNHKHNRFADILPKYAFCLDR
jgi:hypothetical protein